MLTVTNIRVPQKLSVEDKRLEVEEKSKRIRNNNDERSVDSPFPFKRSFEERTRAMTEAMKRLKD